MLTVLTTFSVNVPMIPDQGKIWSVYHLIKLSDNADRPEEVRGEVFTTGRP